MKQPFHVCFTNILTKIAGTSYYNSVIKALIMLLPYELPDSPKYPFGWNFFTKSIPNFNNQSMDKIDLVVLFFIDE
jgi:hypothetical protein